ncbi:MAG TPA: hypothetical protein VIC84_15090 [Blastocatellia bacterium]|jgi:hypothetical protein
MAYFSSVEDLRRLGSLGQSTYQSDAAARQAAKDLFAKFESDCRGVDVLKRLRRGNFSLWDETLMLGRRIEGLPRLFQEKADLERRARIWQASPEKNRVFTDPVSERRRLEEFVRRTGALSPEAFRVELARLMAPLGYPPNYHLTDLNSELRQARCEYAMNSLRWSGPCGGMEVDDPKDVSRQVADHYVQTELGSTLSNQRIACSLFGRNGFCDVFYPGGVIIRVNFSKVPFALIATQVAPKIGPPREFSYSCFKRKVNLN